MTKRLRPFLYIAAVLALIAGVSAQDSESPAQVPVDASKLPASCEVLGAKVTLQPIKLKNKIASLEMSIDGRNKSIVLDQTKVFSKGKELNIGYWTNLCGDGQTINSDITPPSGAQCLDIFQEFHIKAKSKKVRFTFLNQDLKQLPVRKQIGSATVTLRGIGIGKLTDKDCRFWREPLYSPKQVQMDKQHVVLQLDLVMPGLTEFEGHAMNGGCYWNYSDKHYEIEDSKPTMRADGRSAVGAVACTSDVVSDADDIFERELEKLTLKDDASSEKLSRLAMNTANTRMRVWLAFPTNGKMPKDISFEMSVQLPPDESERAVVVFKNAPIR